MAKNQVTILGIAKAVKEFQKRAAKVKSFTPKAMRDIGQDLLAKSVQEAPLDTADLRGSGFTEVDGTTTTVGYTQIYATRQHEELEYNHPRGGKAKYLEDPLNQNINRYIKFLKDSTKKAVD